MIARFPLAILALVLSAPAMAQYQLILDGEDTAWRSESPVWQLDKTGTYLGNYKFSAPGPGPGTNLCVWDIDAIPTGTYSVEFYADNGNYAAAAEFVVESDAGITTLTRSQNFVPTGWHSLGTFTFTGSGRVTQTDHWTGAGTKVIADALRLTYQGTPPALPPAGVTTPEVTLVIDDLGALNPNDPSTYTYQLYDQAPQVTYAVIPFLTYTQATLQKAQALNIQTILHQPMQYIGQPDFNASDPTRLYINQTPTQLLTTLTNNLTNVSPYVWGVNNHQGSRFSQYAPGLHVVLDEMKSRNLFFLDSRTISDSVSYDLARNKGMFSNERDLFVDGNTIADTRALIESVGQRALYAPNYDHIMICHQRPATVPGVFQALNTLQTSGVVVKKLERNLHYIMEVDNYPPGASVQVTGAWTTTTRDMISHECRDGVALRSSAQNASVRFRPNLPRAGYYKLFAASSTDPALQMCGITVRSLNGTSSMNQQHNQLRGQWFYLLRYPFAAGTSGYVDVTTGFGLTAGADAIKFVYDGPLPSEVPDWSRY